MQEPMKQRFKKKYPYPCAAEELHFKDSINDVGKRKREFQYKPHSHIGGRKPAWRKKRRTQRRYKSIWRESLAKAI